jgi:biotin carboxylase
MKLLALGASTHQVPAITAVIAAGYTVITADNRPGNPGHRLAHASHLVDVADHAALVALARSLAVDGVIGYASEVCARAAAHVAWEIGLPGPGRDAVDLLSHKDKFRDCLTRAGIQSLPWQAFAADEIVTACEWAEFLGGRVVVKPVDNSGGRGITILPKDLPRAIAHAAAHSWNRRVIIEAHVGRVGSQVGGDGWMDDGELRFFHCFDNDTLPPPADGAAIRETFPTTHPAAAITRLRDLLGRAARAAGYTRGPINFDACFTGTGEPFVFEIAPRNGGNLIPLLIRHRTGVDLAAAVVAAAMNPGFRLPAQAIVHAGCHAIWVMHADASGRFARHRLDPVLDPHVLACHEYVSRGDAVSKFTTAGDATGILHLEFPDRAVMDKMMADMPALCKVELLPS